MDPWDKFLSCPNIIQLCSCHLGECFFNGSCICIFKKMLQLRQPNWREKCEDRLQKAILPKWL